MSAEIQQWSVRDVEVMASRVAKSRLFGLDESQAFTLMLIAQAEGCHPITAVQRYHVIQGRPSKRSDAMLADFQAVGGVCLWLTASNDREKAEAVFTHPRYCPDGQTVTFDLEDAKAAGLAGKDNWRQYAPSMLRARVISAGIRMVAPGIVAGLYTPEEVGDFAHPIDVKQREALPNPAENVTLPDPDIPKGITEDEALDRVADQTEIGSSREPGCDDIPATSGDSKKDGRWLFPRTERRGHTAWYQAFGREHGYPDLIVQWSPKMVALAIEARKKAVVT